MYDMLETVYAAQEHYEQRLADAERSCRYSRNEVNLVRYSAILRRLCHASGNLLIALGMRLKAMPPVVRPDEAANEIIR